MLWLLCLTTKVPALTVTLPVKVLLPESVRVPVVVLLTPEVPARRSLSPLLEVGPEDGEGSVAGANGPRVAARASFSAAAPFDQPGAPRRVVRLSSDPAPADRHVDASPLWRRAEPGDNPALAELLADDIAAWIAACEA